MTHLFLLSCFITPALGQEILFSEDFSTQPENRWKQTVLKGKSYDTFAFKSPQYFPQLPIDGNCAFFDVYKAGIRNLSNGDRSTETSAIKSPSFKIKGKPATYLTFDYQFIKLRNPSISLEITTDSGTTWKEIWKDSLGRPQAQNVELDLNPHLPSNAVLSFRFLWKTTDTFLHQGYVFLDNIMLYNRLKHDVAVKAGPKDAVICPKGGPNIWYEAVNAGQNQADTVVLRLEVFKNSSSVYLGYDTIYKLPASGRIRRNVNQILPVESGSYSMMVSRLYSDDLQLNDTGTAEFTISDSLTAPVTFNDIRCGKGSIELKSANFQDSILWSNKNAQTLGSGWLFKTPVLDKSDTFYARKVDYQSYRIPSSQGPYRFNSIVTGGSFVELIAGNDLRIISVQQHFAHAGDTSLCSIFFRKGSPEGAYQDSTKWTFWHKEWVVSTAWGDLKNIDFPDIYLRKGDTLALYICFNGKAPFTFKKGEFKGEAEGLSMTCKAVNNKLFSISGTLYQPYSWDGSVEYSTICSSPGALTKAIISPKPKGVAMMPAKTFSGLIKSGSMIQPDEVYANKAAHYQCVPPTGRMALDYGKTWSVQHVEVLDKSGNTLTNKTSYTTSLNAQGVLLSITMDSSLTEEILSLNVTVKDHGLNCDTTLQRHFRSSFVPRTAFVFTNACQGAATSFENQTIEKAGQRFLWMYDDGTTDTSRNAKHIFGKNKTYFVKLIAYNRFGLSDTLVKPVTIHLFAKSSIRAIHTCLGIPAELQNISGNAPLINAYYVWVYDGDTIHASPSPQPFKYSFSTIGVHEVKLISNHMGCVDSTTKNVFQFENPTAQFTLSGSCQYDSFRIQNISTIPGKDRLGYRWLRDGQTFSTNTHPSGILSDYGKQQITLLVTSEFNCADTFIQDVDIKAGVKAEFQVGLACKNDSTKFINNSFNPAKLPVVYHWDFGNGAWSNQEQVQHFFTEVGEKNISLKAVLNNGCSTTFDTTVVVRVNPIAHFEVDDICAGDEAIFLNKSKLENKILQYRWSFGDGDSSIIHSPRHTYLTNEAATYLVRLKVFTTQFNCSDEYFTTINVNQKPGCDFGMSLIAPPSLTYKFYPRDSSLTNFTWSFGGGGTSSDKDPIHSFQDNENRVVRLFGINQYGCTCMKEIEISPGITGVGNIAAEVPIRVFPNPFVTSFHIQGIGENSEITMYDIHGRILNHSTKKDEDQTVVTVQNIAPGLVVLQIWQGHELLQFRLLKL